VNMRVQMVMGYQGVDQVETGGPSTARVVLQFLPTFVDDILYIHDIRLHVYIYIYIHTYTLIYIYIYYNYLHTGHMVTF